MVDISRKNPSLTGTKLTNSAMGAGGGGFGFGTGSKVISSSAASPMKRAVTARRTQSRDAASDNALSEAAGYAAGMARDRR